MAVAKKATKKRKDARKVDIVIINPIPFNKFIFKRLSITRL